MATKLHCDACNGIHDDPVFCNHAEELENKPTKYVVYRGLKFGTFQMDICNVCCMRVSKILGRDIIQPQVETPRTPGGLRPCQDTGATASDFI